MKKNKKTMFYSLPLFGNHFFGEFLNMATFSAAFQIWCRQFSVTDEESLALWVAGTENAGKYFEKGAAEKIAKNAIKKIPNTGPPINLTNH